MASAFGHATAGAALAGSVFPKRKLPAWFYALAAGLAIFPDVDAIGFHFGVPYESVWGHRGFTHSIFFAAAFSCLVCLGLKPWSKKAEVSRSRLLLCLFVVMLSHSLLDAMTNGGLGVGFFAPFSSERYFFPIHPILVSPIGVLSFFSFYGLQVLKSEALWIGVPAILMVSISRSLAQKA